VLCYRLLFTASIVVSFRIDGNACNAPDVMMLNINHRDLHVPRMKAGEDLKQNKKNQDWQIRTIRRPDKRATVLSHLHRGAESQTKIATTTRIRITTATFWARVGGFRLDSLSLDENFEKKIRCNEHKLLSVK